jgi:hypothetical protein
MTYRLICTTPPAELAWAFGAANGATTATPELVPGPRGLAPSSAATGAASGARPCSGASSPSPHPGL